jgi:uncharacterized protein YbaR (Trm112 family)
MAVDPFLLEILVCPETKTNVAEAPAELVKKLNALIEKGALQNRAGHKVADKIEGALVRQDNAIAYPVRDDIPVMLIDEQIPLDQLR